ncbi:MAG: UDP-N-acetylmuramoyl-L-alanyl-D-glutamate--2,6-diaminopimelate ligase [Clostridiales bacterium]
MKLKDLLFGLEYSLINGNMDMDITDIAYDSRKVKNGSLFVCIKGYKTDGHKFITKSIENGAKVIIIQDDYDIKNSEVTVIKINDTRYGLAFISTKFFKEPSKNFNLIGITGTKGKTTITYMVKSILEKENKLVGIIGTISNKIGEETISIDRTTPESYDLQSLFYDMSEKNVDSVVMEVSSHGLDLHRVSCNEYDIGLFTNLTRDHLDFHKTFDNYFEAKMKLFDISKLCLVNIDSDYGKKAYERYKNKAISFGIKEKADFRAINIKLHQDSVNFDLEVNGKVECMDIVVSIPGEFNVYNALSAAAVCNKSGLDFDTIKKGLLNLKVPGRAEVVDIDKNFTVIIDYSHTPDSLENILKTIKGYAKGRLVCLIGCGGDRDRTKRPIMGKISGEMADFTIITSDNPRTEDPEFIISEIIDGIKEANTDFVKITDRYKAIEFALKNAIKDDIILLAGKGHETYQMFKDKTIKFDEVEIVKEIISRG